LVFVAIMFTFALTIIRTRRAGRTVQDRPWSRSRRFEWGTSVN